MFGVWLACSYTSEAWPAILGFTAVFAALFLAIPTVTYWLGLGVLTMEIFPSEKFAQMSSGMNVFACGALIFGNLLIGQIFDYIHGTYSLIFAWCAVFYSLALIPAYGVYKGWKLHGGPSNYVPPQPL